MGDNSAQNYCQEHYKTKSELQTSKEFSYPGGRALRRTAKVERKTARMRLTPVYAWKNGRVVAEKP